MGLSIWYVVVYRPWCWWQIERLVMSCGMGGNKLWKKPRADKQFEAHLDRPHPPRLDILYIRKVVPRKAGAGHSRH